MGKLCHNCRRPMQGGWRTGFSQPCDCALEWEKLAESNESDEDNSELDSDESPSEKPHKKGPAPPKKRELKQKRKQPPTKSVQRVHKGRARPEVPKAMLGRSQDDGEEEAENGEEVGENYRVVGKQGRHNVLECLRCRKEVRSDNFGRHYGSKMCPKK